MRLVHLLAAAALFSTASVIAAPTAGFVSSEGTGAGSEADAILSKRAIDTALISGIRSAGGDVNPTKPGYPVVEVTLSILYVPKLDGFRSVVYSIALRDEVTYHGKTVPVGVCGFNAVRWNAGENETAHVQALLQHARDLGATFAKACLK